DKHRYAIYRFKYTGTYFKKTNLGETKYRYSSLDTDDAFKNVLISIKQKEQILNSVSVNEYANSYGR
ncbi:hypothetical protein, partial [Enterococcus faecium]